MKRWMVLAAVGFVAVFACDSKVFPPKNVAPVAARVPTAYNVVVLMIDGPRGTEAFEDTLHENVPRMWNDLVPQGTFFSDFANGGLTLTNPGHASVATGTWQMIDNAGANRPDRPTIFEYFRKATGAPQTDAWVVSGKTKLNVISYSTDPGYGAAYGASVHVGFPDDVAVRNDLISVLASDHPRLVFGCFPQVDLMGHSGVWADYLAALPNVDSLVVGVWNWLQADAFYAGKTYMFVTADHGRHDDAHGGFQSHGDGCPGCRRLFCIAVGPGIKVGHVVTNPYAQRDLCATIGRILGVPTPASEGSVMEEMFEPAPTGVLDRR